MTPRFDAFIDSLGCGVAVQPRLGGSDPAWMETALDAVKALPFPTVGTLTVDSFTRTGRLAEVARAIRIGERLNGYPILSHPTHRNRELVDRVQADGFPLQVRHGCADPWEIVAASVAAGIHATEGGPVSYCLPYGRVPLARSVASWSRTLTFLSGEREAGAHPHVETFGGCLLGQLMPPALLLALSVLEAVYFERHGIPSISLSYAQGTSPEQDAGALLALHRLASRCLAASRWHVVLYTFMGLFPRTRRGARTLIEESAKLAVAGGCKRLVVKTAAEARGLPSLRANLVAMQWAAGALGRPMELDPGRVARHREDLEDQATALVESVLDLSRDLGKGLLAAFRKGYLDLPYCLHPDNPRRATSTVDGSGEVVWSDTGRLPLPRRCVKRSRRAVTWAELMRALSYHRDRLDVSGAEAPAPRAA